MTIDVRSIVSWSRDVAIAYAGGLVLGAPLALGAVWLTGRDGAATASLLAAMGLLLLALRRREAPVESRPVIVAPAVRRRAA